MSDYGIKTYADLAETCGNMVLANEMAKRPLELVSGDWAPWEEIFQWYIIQDPSFVMGHTGEPVFYDEELDLYVLGGKSSRHGLAARARSDNLRLKRRRRAQRNNRCALYFFCFADTQDALSTRRHFTPGLVEKLREDCPVYGACRSAFYNCRNFRQIQPLKHALFSTAFHAIYQEKSPWLPPLYASGAKKAKGHKGD